MKPRYKGTFSQQVFSRKISSKIHCESKGDLYSETKHVKMAGAVSGKRSLQKSVFFYFSKHNGKTVVSIVSGGIVMLYNCSSI